MATTMEIRYCDIPAHLQKGGFFRSLSESDPEGTIQIPDDCFAAEETCVAKDLEQFTQLLRVMMYWVLDEIPLGIMTFCSENDIEMWRDIVLNFPGGDKSSLVKGLLATFSKKNLLDFDQALKVGDWDVITRCVDMMNPDYENATLQAAQLGHLRALKLLHERKFVWHKNTCTFASQEGHLDCVRFAHENGCPWDMSVYFHAMIYGHLHCIQYAHQQGLEWTAEVSKYAAQYGQLACLQYLLDHDCPVDINACNVAAQEGHLHCLQLLHQYSVPWDASTCVRAAMCYNTSCLQYLHENGCPWDSKTPTQAALIGNINALRYTFEHGCMYYGNLLAAAAHSGSMECITYLVEEQLLHMSDSGSLIFAVLLRGNLQCLQYLIDQGCVYHTALFEAHRFATYDIAFKPNNPEFVLCLQYLEDRGWCIDSDCFEYLVDRDWDNCVEYFTMQGYVAPEVESVDMETNQDSTSSI